MKNTIGIVDDERIVIYGIQSLLSEVAPSCGVTGFRSAEEGLRFCMDRHPDLLFTDIGMPGMNGLDLIREIRRCDRTMKIVVLSCHDEFDMVHQAFILGADDYLLKKDIDRRKLAEILEKLLPGKGGNPSPRGSGGLPSRLSERWEENPGKAGVLGILGFKEEYDGKADYLPWQPDLSMIHQIIREALGAESLCYLGPRNELVIFDPRPEGEPDRFSLLERIRVTVSKYINRRVYVAALAVRPGENWSSVYLTGREILDGAFYAEKSALLFRQTEKPLRPRSLTFSLSDEHPEVRWTEGLREFLESAREKLDSPESVKAELIFALKHLLHHLRENGEAGSPDSSPREEWPYYRKIAQFDDCRQLESWVEDFLQTVITGFRTGKRYRSAVYNARQFIRENLSGDLRLSTVSGHLGFNPSHLSTMFKKETGESYTGYVNRMRVEHARELLETTALSAKEISFLCGYTNPNYFSRIFKSVTGRTFSDCRAGDDAENCE